MAKRRQKNKGGDLDEAAASASSSNITHPKPLVFISHATDDRSIVERDIIAPLERSGISTWYSVDAVQTAAEWEREIRQGLARCDWFLVAVSPAAKSSQWVKAEVGWALENRKALTELNLRSGKFDTLTRLIICVFLEDTRVITLCVCAFKLC